jgi:teichuronic acid biosynthesis glycosyltransferase TuaC
VNGRPLLTLERVDGQAQVLVVTNGWPHDENDGYGVFIKRQTESLIARGLRCDVLFIRGYRSPLAYLIAALRLGGWSLFRRRRYQLVHTHSGEAALAAAFYRRCPLLVSYLGDDVLGTPNASGTVTTVWRIRRGLVRQHSRLATRTITKSQEMEQALPSGVRARNTVLPNGVDTQLFRPIDRDVARRELGWPAEGRVALFAADPGVPRKRYWLARAAIEEARLELDDLRLEVACGVSPDRMPWLMNAADCLLLTSSIEGSPNVVKEALMCNLPVVCTRAGDVTELLDGVAPSYLCDAAERPLGEALVQCLGAPRRSNGRRMSSRLDSRSVADSLLRLYRELVPTLELEEGDAAGLVPTEAGAS